MAVAEVTSAAATPGTGSSFTISITVSGSHPAITVKVGLDHATAVVNSVSWSGGSGTPYQIKNVRSSSGAFVSVWAIPSPGAGAGTVTVNLSTSALFIGTATVFSGTDDTTPSPIADAVTSTSQTPPVTLTPTNLTANDASDGLAANITSGNWNSLSQNQRFVNNTSDPGYISGDSSGTTGITFTNDGGVPAGSAAQVAVRVQIPQGITGTGALAAQSSTASGSGTVTGFVTAIGFVTVFLYQGEVNPNDVRLTDPTVVASTAVHGTGSLTSANSSASGAGTSRSTGTGALAASASSVAGTGTVSSPVTVTGSGSLAAQPAQVTGLGTSRSTGTGALAAQSAQASGAGIVGAVASGALVSQNSSASGTAAARWVARSELYLLEDGSGNYLLEDGSGRYAIEEVRLIAQNSQISGTATNSTPHGDTHDGDGGDDDDLRDLRDFLKHTSDDAAIVADRLRKECLHRQVASAFDEVYALAPSVQAAVDEVVTEAREWFPEYRVALDLPLYLDTVRTMAEHAARAAIEADDEEILMILRNRNG